ncbi:MAG: hypothetical protein JSU03_13075 [Bacteroidetes bacterium]|nr:hypothetical protein [Bacteroidota bacterium]
MKYFETIFNQFYVWACKYNFANSPHLSAMYFLGFSLFFNLWSITNLIRLLMGLNFFQFEKCKYIIFIGLAVITLVIYFLYIKNKKYLIIYKEYSLKSKSLKIKFNYITIGYIFFSIVLFFGVAFFAGLHKRGVW